MLKKTSLWLPALLSFILFTGAIQAAEEEKKSTCGNGQLEAGEECEGPEGIKDPATEKCSVDCKIVKLILNTPKVFCGNGIKELGEECDGRDGLNDFSGQSCTIKCRIVDVGIDSQYDIPQNPGELNDPGLF